MKGKQLSDRMQRKTAYLVAIATMLMVSGGFQGANANPHHRLACPARAPAAWRLPQPAPLDQAAVLSQPAGQPIDESAPPSLVPDHGYARGQVWHNVWMMDDQPGWSHFVDCRYRGSDRVLRLKADGLRRCEQTARPYSVQNGVANDAVQTLVCD